MSRAKSTAESYVRYLEDWIEIHLSEPIRLEDMAAAVNLASRSSNQQYTGSAYQSGSDDKS